MRQRWAATAALVFGVICTLPSGVAEEDPAAKIIGAALVESRAYSKLAWLSDRIGHRLSGSVALERAIVWTQEELRRDGIDHVWTEEVMVPHWVRGEESARIVEPVQLEMPVLALGGSVPTPGDGLRAEVVVVHDMAELEELGALVKGKIVLFNKPILRNGGGEHGYGSASGLRVNGPTAAARQGAVGTLIRSLGTADYRLPHTGSLQYREDAPKVPAAAIAAEDAELIERLLKAGETVEVELHLGCETLPDAKSANVLAEIRGTELPEEIVLIGAHLDTWDVGSGAHDDGAGVVVVMETLRLLKQIDLAPRRTIRAVLFTNEENGLQGGRAYATRHRKEMARHVAAIESDAGGGTPLGFGITAGAGSVEIIEEIVGPLGIIDADQVTSRGGGADISRMREYGVPQMGLRQDTTVYFDYHHTEADTLDKVDEHDLNRNVAAMAWMAYSLADREGTLPRLTPEMAAGTVEPVTLRASDGVTIHGDLGLPAGATKPSPAVILIHQGGSDRSEWVDLKRKLMANRIAVLAYDVRGHGESDNVEDAGALFDDPNQAPRDLIIALEFLRSHDAVDPERIGVVGSSLGSNLACVASSSLGIRTAVAISGKGSAAENLAGEAGLSLSSVFHVASEGDQGGKRAKWARELYERTEPPRRLEIVEGSEAHGVSIFDDAPLLPERIVDWLKRTL